MTATNERERLITWAKQLADPNWCLSVPKEAKDTIAALVKELEPRTITTVEDLAALPNAAVIRDRARDVAEKRGGLWCQYETSDMTDSQMAKFLPAVVLDEGKR